MTTPSPVEVLREAAAKLRERAGLATPGPWHIGNAVDPTKPVNIHAFPSARLVADQVGWLDSEYIATVSPPVGLAIADLLESLGSMPPHLTNTVDFRYGVALARAILGSTS